MTELRAIEARAAKDALFVSGTVAEEDGSIVLFSPDEPGFWPHFKDSPEARDGAPDPLDRWSDRVISAIARDLDGEPLLPFGGPPWHPFLSWANASGRAWTSPVGLTVHDRAGLFISFRGAVRLGTTVRSEATSSPCPECAAPCRTACPVDAFAGGAYDVPRCKAYLDTPAGLDCRNGGCLVRRACPVGADLRRPEQSAFHMEAFAPR